MTDPLVETWLAYLARERALSPHTVATYRRSLRTIEHPATANREAVEAWWSSRADNAIATRLNELAALRSFLTWCRVFEHRPPTDDPTYRIVTPRLPKGLPRPISRHDLTTLLGALGPDIRRAVSLGAYAGLRVSEAAALPWHDIDQETRRIRVTGKGRKVRLVGLSALLLDSLLPDTGRNVVTGRDPMTGPTLQRKANRAIRAAGVEATFHQLRHRYGTVALASTGNLLAVSRAMGHQSVTTTAGYAATSDADLDLIAAAVTL